MLVRSLPIFLPQQILGIKIALITIVLIRVGIFALASSGTKGARACFPMSARCCIMLFIYDVTYMSALTASASVHYVVVTMVTGCKLVSSHASNDVILL